MTILEVNGLKKIYSTRFGGNKVEALKNVNFSVEQLLLWANLVQAKQHF